MLFFNEKFENNINCYIQNVLKKGGSVARIGSVLPILFFAPLFETPCSVLGGSSVTLEFRDR